MCALFGMGNFSNFAQRTSMPEVKPRIKGVVFQVYNGDHLPPHFHAIYQNDEVLIDIREKTVLKGWLPTKKLQLAMEFLEANQKELLELFYEQNPSLRPL